MTIYSLEVLFPSIEPVNFSMSGSIPMNSMKRQKDMTLKDELPRSAGAQYATGEEWRNNSERMKTWSQIKNNAQL